MKPRNSDTGKVGSRLSIEQGRKPKNKKNPQNTVPVYVDGVLKLIEDNVVTRYEVLDAWSINCKSGKRTGPRSWNELLKKKGFKTGGRPRSWLTGTTSLRSSGATPSEKQAIAKQFQEIQKLIHESLRK